ncbi:MAG: hypothetical protein KBC73_13840 [Burkholderiaceae bacterium]|nr:hypothetical protein [Burkholderiaceae bacterium]
MPEQVKHWIAQAMAGVSKDYGQAMGLLVAAQARAHELGEQGLRVKAIVTEARLALRRRPVVAVLARHRDALRLARDSGLAEALYDAHLGQARTWADLDLPRPGLLASDRAAQCLPPGEAEQRLGWLALRAGLRSQAGDTEAADALYEHLLLQLQDHHGSPVHGATLHNRACHLERSGRLDEALVQSQQAEAALGADDLADSGLAADLVACRVRILVGLGRPDEALAQGRAWLARQPVASAWVSGVWSALAEALLRQDDAPAADEANRRARAIALQLGVPRTAPLLLQASRIARQLGQRSESAQLSEQADAETLTLQRLAQAA